jgi:hypothetical protein
MAGCGRGGVIAHPATTHFRSPQVKLTTPSAGTRRFRGQNCAFEGAEQRQIAGAAVEKIDTDLTRVAHGVDRLRLSNR